MSRPQKLGFVGLGNMGQPMLARLLSDGYEVSVFNRSRAKCETFRDRGVDVAATPRELSSRSDVVITMLANDDALKSVMLGADGLLAGAHGNLIIDMGSTAPDTSVQLAAACADASVAMIDAPVAGTVRAAADGSLVIMAGGDAQAVSEVTDILSVLGKPIFHVGPSGSGSRMKLVVNILLSLTSQALAEALTFGAAQGLDPRQVHEVLSATPSSSGVVVRKGKAMLDRNFAPIAPLRLLHKDLGHALAVGQNLGIPMPATATAHAIYSIGMARGHGEEDFAAIFAVMEHLAGIDARPADQ